jgi:hypothetical protein
MKIDVHFCCATICNRSGTGMTCSSQGWSESMVLQLAIGAIWANPQPEGLDAELFSLHVNPEISDSAYKHGS